MMKKTLIYILVLVSSLPLLGQTTGRVLLSSSNEPAAYINVVSEKSGSGTYTNEGGVFQFFNDLSADDTIKLFGIGIENKTIALRDIKETDQIIVMATSYALAEVQVLAKSIDPKQIIEEAISKIDQNYYHQAVMEEAFYREISEIYNDHDSVWWKGKGDPLTYGAKINESILHIWNSEITSNKKAQSKQIYSRELTSENITDKSLDSLMKEIFESMEIKGGINTATANNIYNFKDYGFLSQMKNYEYTLVGTSMHGDDEVYLIEFQPIYKKGSYTGELLIKKESLSFLEINYALSEEEKLRNRGIKILGFEIRTRDEKSRLMFKETSNGTQLDYVRGYYSFWFGKNNEDKKGVAKRTKFGLTWNSTYELDYQKTLQLNAAPLHKKEAMKKKAVLKVDTEVDDPIWSKYQIIPIPQDVIDRLNGRSME